MGGSRELSRLTNSHMKQFGARHISYLSCLCAASRTVLRVLQYACPDSMPQCQDVCLPHSRWRSAKQSFTSRWCKFGLWRRRRVSCAHFAKEAYCSCAHFATEAYCKYAVLLSTLMDQTVKPPAEDDILVNKQSKASKQRSAQKLQLVRDEEDDTFKLVRKKVKDPPRSTARAFVASIEA